MQFKLWIQQDSWDCKFTLLNQLVMSYFIHILNCKMSLFCGIRFFGYTLLTAKQEKGQNIRNRTTNISVELITGMNTLHARCYAHEVAWKRAHCNVYATSRFMTNVLYMCDSSPQHFSLVTHSHTRKGELIVVEITSVNKYP